MRDGIRGGLIPVIINKKTLQNIVKTSESGKSRYPTNPMRPNGVTGAPRGPQSSAKAHVENPWENKGKQMFLEVPLCHARDGIRGERFPDNNGFAA